MKQLKSNKISQISEIIDIDNLLTNDNNILNNDLFLFHKLKNKTTDLQSEIKELKQEIYQLKETNNHLISENQNLSMIIKTYKEKESLYLLTKENLKKLSEDYESLKLSLLDERSKFQFELRLKDSLYDHDVVQSNIRSEKLEHQMDNFSYIKKLNEILYIKNDELKKNLDMIKEEEKVKLEEMEIKYNKKIDNYKKKMLEFLKRNEEERFKMGTQTELNNKLNILHIQELINELEIQGVEVEDLLKERQELKMKILELNRDLFIYQEVIDTMTKKNYNFQNKLKKISNNIKDFYLPENKKKSTKFLQKLSTNQTFTEPNEKSLNIMEFKNRNQTRNLSSNDKGILKLVDKYNSQDISKNSFTSLKKRVKLAFPKSKMNNKRNEYNDKNKVNRDILFKEREKYKDLYEFYKDKFELIKNKYTHIFNMYNEVLEKIYNEDIIKINKDNISIDINDFKEFKFENMSSEQKYAILIKLINNIAPLVYRKDLENNLMIQDISKVKEKYNFNGPNSMNSFNFSGQSSTKIPSVSIGFLNLKKKTSNFNDSFRTSTTILGGTKTNKSINSFDDFKKIFGIKKVQKNNSLLHFGNSKIDISLFPRVNLLE